jgi:hypothetical protein
VGFQAKKHKEIRHEQNVSKFGVMKARPASIVCRNRANRPKGERGQLRSYRFLKMIWIRYFLRN